MSVWIARALRLLPRSEAWRLALPSSWERFCLCFLLAIGLEGLGRAAPSDWIEGIGVAALAGGIGLLAATRREAWKRRALALRALLLRAALPLRVRYGLDLRGAPPLAERIPVEPLVACAATLGLVGLAWSARDAFPGAARKALRGVSGLGYLVYLTALWSALASSTLAASFGIGSFLRQSLGPARPRLGQLSGAALFLALGSAALLCPPRWALAAILATGGALVLVLWISARDLRVAWCRPGDGGPPSWGRFGAFEACAVLWVLALGLLPALLAVGERFDGPGTSATAATALLGRVSLWTLAGFSGLVLGTNALRLARARLADPGRRLAPRVLVQGAAAELGRAAEALRAAGFRPVFRPRPGAMEVCVHLAEEPGADRERWPLAVARSELGDRALHARLVRRDQVQRRRALGKGLERLLRAARRDTYERGSGFWIAPHLWVATHLTRDQDEESGRTIGPAYRRALPRAARSHLAEVLADLEIDLLYVEDGVRPRSFRRVLALVFEHHDLFGARRCADERHFSGIPGVRVLLHDVGFGEAWTRPGYPEPEHEDLGRARVLHVFRDRGAERARDESPLDGARLPASPRLAPVLR